MKQKPITLLLMKEIKKLKSELIKYKSLSFHDSLTGLYNRRKLNQDLDKFIYEHKRYKTRFSLIMIDMINFKRINDTFGHQKGDLALKSIARILKNCTRKIDHIYRYGGDEFIILLPHTTLKITHKIARRLALRIPIHISIAKIIDNKEKLLKILDKKLYERKRGK